MKTAILLVSIAVAACSASPEELCAAKVAKLESMRREAQADLIRQRAECQAVAVEFIGDRMMVDNCLDTLKFTAQTTQSTLALIERRYGEPDVISCANLVSGGVAPQYVHEQEVFGKPAKTK
jgi:hypothetical protein